MGKNAPALSSFNAGELSPDFAGRVDNEKYPVGCSTLQRFIPRVQGPARRTPGTRYVQSVKTSTQRTWLRKFIFSQAQAYQIEFGNGYCRFYTNHGQVQTAPNVAYEIASPYSAADLTNADGTCALQLEQSGDVVYISCPTVWPQTLKRLGPTNWVFSPYAPPDGPFLDQNASNSPALYVTTIAGSPNQVTCHATAPVFSAADVGSSTSPGRLVRIDVQYFNTQPWTDNVSYTAGDLTRYNGNTYLALNTATSGPSPPVHTAGTAFDGKGGVLWLYQDSGYGIGQVTAFTSSTQVTLTLSPYAGQTGQTAGGRYYRFPADTIGVTKSITGISQASQAVVTSTAHGYSVGDPVYLTSVGGMTQISEQVYVIVAVTANTFTLPIDSSGFSAYTSGGTAIKNASLRWQLGAWGSPTAQTPGTYPAVLAFYLDRLFLARGIQWWGSAPGQYDSHTQDLFSLITSDCAVSGVIASKEVDDITWMSELNILLFGTKGGEFGLSSIVPNNPLGPGNTQVVRQSNWRAKDVRAQVIGTSNFYIQSSGKKVMAQDYNFYIDRYDSTNQTRIANHIAGYGVTSGLIDLDWHQEPYECVWGVRSDGLLVGYVFDRPDNVTGWHEQPLGVSRAGAAVVECVSVIPAPDGTRDEVWMIVKRTINGATVRSIEYMEKDYETGDVQSSACYVDMSAQYNGSPTTIITGLNWLEGETVSVLRDGGGHPDCVVSSGQITLQYPGSVVQIGLRCPATLDTMDIEGGADVGTAQGKVKRVVVCTVRVKNTLGGFIGMAGGPLDLMQPNVSTTLLGSPPPLTTGDIDRISIPGDVSINCKIRIQQSDPFPMEIIAIFPSITVQEVSAP